MFHEERMGKTSEFNSDLNLPYAAHNSRLSWNRGTGMISSMPKQVTLRDLFPDESEQQIERIGEFLHGYCSSLWRIFERLEREHPEVIDELMKARSMKGKVDSSNKTN